MAKINLLRDHADLKPAEWVMVVQYYKTHTALETATKFGLIHKQALITALAREYPKGMKHGGARKGAGNTPDKEKKELQNLLMQVEAIKGLHTLPNPDDITQDNAAEKAHEAANVLRGTIAALRDLVVKIAALGVAAWVVYVIIF